MRSQHGGGGGRFEGLNESRRPNYGQKEVSKGTHLNEDKLWRISQPHQRPQHNDRLPDDLRRSGEDERPPRRGPRQRQEDGFERRVGEEGREERRARIAYEGHVEVLLEEREGVVHHPGGPTGAS